jgi:hypothetical protein
MKLRAPTSVEAFLLAVVVIVGITLVARNKAEDRATQSPSPTVQQQHPGEQGGSLPLGWL